MDNDDFRTFSEYMKSGNNLVTASMEDYLEMIFRLSKEKGFARISELSEALNVQPPSATRMVQKLGAMGLIQYERYGVILLRTEGKRLGEVLLKKHDSIESFFRLLGVSEESVLSETEKAEHTLKDETVECFERCAAFLTADKEIELRFRSYCANQQQSR